MGHVTPATAKLRNGGAGFTWLLRVSDAADRTPSGARSTHHRRGYAIAARYDAGAAARRAGRSAMISANRSR
jgi:hypothetical protein